MSVQPIYSRQDRARVQEANKQGIAVSSLRPKPIVLGWDVRWRPAPGANPLGQRLLKAKGFVRKDAGDLDQRIKRLLSETGGYAPRSLVFPPVSDDQASLTLEQYAQDTYVPYIMDELKPSTQTTYLRSLDEYILYEVRRTTRRDGTVVKEYIPTELAANPIAEITLADVTAWKARHTRRGAARRRLEIAIETLQSLFSLAVEDEVIEKSPVHGPRSRRLRGKRRKGRAGRVKPVMPSRVVDPDDIEIMRRERELCGVFRDYVVIGLLAYVGLRPSEVGVLYWDELLDANGMCRPRVEIKRGFSQGPDGKWVEVDVPKDGEYRVATLFDPIREEIDDFYDRCGRPPLRSRAFLSMDGNPLVPKHIGDRVREARLAAGLPHSRPYDLRHTDASLLHAGGDEESAGRGWATGEIAAHLGHSIEVCTTTYLHVFKQPSRYRGVPIEQVIRNARLRALAKMPGEATRTNAAAARILRQYLRQR